MFNRIALGSVILALAASAGLADPITVPGTANPWLAGAPDGTVAGGGVDFAPTQSPVLVSVPVFSGAAFSFTVSGSVSNTPGPSGLTPDGAGFYSRSPGAENGIADVSAPINSLIGVFLSDAQADSFAPPSALNFSDLGLDVLTLAPGLQQPFFIGDGLTSGGLAQTFIAPVGATRLYLGTMDGYEWNNNSGAFEVTVSSIPTPGAAAVASLGLLAALRRARR